MRVVPVNEDEIDIKAYLIYIIAISCAWFGKIDWIVAILFILSNITLRYRLVKKDKGAIKK
jgi:hypothetical protein